MTADSENLPFENAGPRSRALKSTYRTHITRSRREVPNATDLECGTREARTRVEHACAAAILSESTTPGLQERASLVRLSHDESRADASTTQEHESGLSATMRAELMRDDTKERESCA